jgi:SAM-dependent methyltransferase
MGPGGSIRERGLSPADPGGDAGVLRAKWDQRYGSAEGLPEPALVLREYAHLLPGRGEALDLACGLGASALWLAERGFRVSAWDLSPVAIRQLSAHAQERGLPVAASVRDVIAEPPPPDCFDLILVAHFLERGLAPAIAAALRPGGLLFYQTFSREAVSDCGPSDPMYRLAPNELLGLFPDLIVRAYSDEGRIGDTGRGIRDLVLLVAQRPEGSDPEPPP